MKVRVKFAKDGLMVYIGHLDILRYFQKCIRKSGIDIAYSKGFSPHQIMSFAAPLGVGIISSGEYMDIEINSHEGRDKFIEDLNSVMVPGMRILNAVMLPDGTDNAMASVAAARYKVHPKEGKEFPKEVLDIAAAFDSMESIIVMKETKKNTLEVDLKPHIYEFSMDEKELNCLVDASSSGNIKSTQILKAFFDMAGLEFNPLDYQVIRVDTYTNIGDENNMKLVPMDQVGEMF